MSNLTFCLTTYNNLDYIKTVIPSIRKNCHFKDAPFIVHAENCVDGTNEWLHRNVDKYNLEVYIEPDNEVKRGIGGGMDFCASKVKTEFIFFVQSDMYIPENTDKYLLDVFDDYNEDDRLVVSAYRMQPDIFNEKDRPRPGTTFIDVDAFGAYHDNFDEDFFLKYADEFVKNNGEYLIRRAEGAGGFIVRKRDWDYIGGTDSRFAPAYWEDHDLFIRMQNENYKFVLTGKALIYHFAGRASRFPDDDLKNRPQHLAEVEQNSTIEFLKKYGRYPDYDEQQFVKPMQSIDGSPNRINREN